MSAMLYKQNEMMRNYLKAFPNHKELVPKISEHVYLQINKIITLLADWLAHLIKQKTSTLKKICCNTPSKYACSL